jgi:anaerobic ribonucleoside-triphosphate reductase
MYHVLKRNGSVVDFDIHKIERAIEKAFVATDKPTNQDIITLLALRSSADFAPKEWMASFPWRISRTAWNGVVRLRLS